MTSKKVVWLFSLSLIFSLNSIASIEQNCQIDIEKRIFENQNLKFIVKSGTKPFSNSAAMNIVYEPILKIRKQISDCIGKKLDFYKEWSRAGEAHITLMTPGEFDRAFYLSQQEKPIVEVSEIQKIAEEEKIQNADLKVLGIGSASLVLEGRSEQTYFLIIDSKKLRKIRKKIFDLFIKKGGKAKKWKYKNYYPHITIGYTKRDFHIEDGVIKDVQHSLDTRFKIKN